MSEGLYFFSIRFVDECADGADHRRYDHLALTIFIKDEYGDRYEIDTLIYFPDEIEDMLTEIDAWDEGVYEHIPLPARSR